jgi:phosphoribosylformylglycinamidine cyclo-ligase
VLLTQAGWRLDRQVPEFGRTLGEELLEPTRIYSLDCLALTGAAEIHAFSHVTGGGLAANLARVIPDHLHARLDRGTWSPLPVFQTVAEVGKVATLEIEKTLNMGVGMVAVVPPESVDVVLSVLADRDLEAWLLGDIVDRTADRGAGAALYNSYPTAG